MDILSNMTHYTNYTISDFFLLPRELQHLPYEYLKYFISIFPKVLLSPLFDPILYPLSWLVFFIVLPGILLFLYSQYTKHCIEPSWVKNTPDAPNTSILDFLFGNLLPSVKSGFICRKYMRGGVSSMLRFHNGIFRCIFRDLILIKNPNVVKEILLEPNTKKPHNGYKVFRRLHGYVGGFDFLSFRSHRDTIYSSTRRVAYIALMKRTFHEYIPTYIPIIKHLLSKNFLSNLDQPNLVKKINHHSYSNGYKIDAVTLCHLIATRVLTSMAFGIESEIDQDLFESTVKVVEDTMWRPQNSAIPLLDWLPTPRNRKLWRNQARLRNTILSLVHRKRVEINREADREEHISPVGSKYPFKELSTNSETPEYTDVVTALINHLQYDVDGHHMNDRTADRTLTGLLGILFFAGFDTTANTMAMVFYYLATHPDVQRKARREVFRKQEESERIGNIEYPPSIDFLFQHSYLLAVIKETLRLFPVVPMISREVTRSHPDGICPRPREEETCGVCVNIFGLHYDEVGWNRPYDFLPERWLPEGAHIDENSDVEGRVYCPFAIGKRSCFGRQFAQVELLTVCCILLTKYSIHTSGSLPPRIKEGGTLSISNLDLIFKDLGHLKSRMSEPSDSELSGGYPSFTIDEISKHNSPDTSIWIVIDGLVYDVSDFLESHPGGPEVIRFWAGSDATSEFMAVGHSYAARQELKKYCIGRVDQELSLGDQLPCHTSSLFPRRSAEPSYSLHSETEGRSRGIFHRSRSMTIDDQWIVNMQVDQMHSPL